MHLPEHRMVQVHPLASISAEQRGDIVDYVRTDDARIQADFAQRIGSIMLQYHSADFIPGYEATLSLCLLQSLLTNCQEHIRSMAKGELRRSFFSNPVSKEEPMWGLNGSRIDTNTFCETLSYEKYLCHLRNALSHPSGSNLEGDYPATGYTSVTSPDGKISGYLLVSSPDVRSKTSGTHPTHHNTEASALQCSQNSSVPGDVEIRESEKGYILYRYGTPFARVFRAILSIDCITQLVIELANHLAQPLVKTWDKEHIEVIVHV